MSRTTMLLSLFALLLACGGAEGEDQDTPVRVVREVEPNDSPAEAVPAGNATHGKLLGALGGKADRDTYRLKGTPGRTLLARLSGPKDSDYDLSLLTVKGRLLATSRASGPIERMIVPVPASGEFLLSVCRFGGPAGVYEVEVRVVPGASPGGAKFVGRMKQARCFHAAAALPDGRTLVAGGTRKATSGAAAWLASLSSTEILDPKQGVFQPGPRLSATRFGPTATVLPDGRVLLAGGDMRGTADIFDPYRSVLSARGVAMAGGSRVLHQASLLPDGRVLLTGGYAFVMDMPPRPEPLASTAIFDPKSDTFSAGPTLARKRTSHADCVLQDGRVLVTGGVGRSGTEIIDLRREKPILTKGPMLGGPRDDHTATVLADGRVLVTGGQTPGGKSVATAEILEDPAAGPGSRFVALPTSMKFARSDHTASLLGDGSVLILGGERDPGGGGKDIILRSVERFDPAKRVFLPMPDLKVGRDDHRVVLFPDGLLLVTGGEDVRSLAIPDVEMYDPR